MGFFFKDRARIPPYATFRITQAGEEKLQQFNGDPQGRVLMALTTRGSQTIQEISSATGMSVASVERILPRLIQGQYIQTLSRGMEAE